MDPVSPEAALPDRSVPHGKRIGLLGLGTVGSAVAARLLDPDWRANATARGHVVPTLVAVAVRDLARQRGLSLPDDVRLTDDIEAVAAADDVDIVVELMGGTDAAAHAIRHAFTAGKRVVSANKELLARQGRELEAAARAAGVGLRFEAAVAAGVPVLGPLVWDLGANRVTALRGIINGTTNHILSTMAAEAREYDDVLREAQARGYAEADPSSDVEGMDAAYKLTLLARLAFDGWLDVDALRRTIPAFGTETRAGIVGVSRAHLSAAARLGLAIKLIARAERLPGGPLRAGVTLMAVSAASPLGATSGVTNVVHFDADPVGRVTMAGPGAGGPATASAVLADVLVFANSNASTWEQLPPAAEMAVEDDLSTERGWLVVIEGLGVAGYSDSVRELALATTDEGFVSRPISLTSLTSRLGQLERPVHAYPILSDA
ncbi:MAG TPA: homoserine dehydrogenase [Candidatus Limnocylindrales bacterium]|nr:homoserine dehydrogenase [Candidatus Limnocylindrales bacterium]